jgi:hypothetical protein
MAVTFCQMIGAVRKCCRAVCRKMSQSEISQRSLNGHSS